MKIGKPKLFLWFLPDKTELYVMARGMTESQIMAHKIADRICEKSVSLHDMYWMFNQDYGVIDEPYY